VGREVLRGVRGGGKARVRFGDRRCARTGATLDAHGGPALNIRLYIDPDTGEPHIARHGVSEDEVSQVLVRPIEDRPGRDESRVALGKTDSGRYIRVVYVPDPDTDSLLVVTAYDIGPGAKRALTRRMRRRK
jgi:hypothetical protein